MYVNNNIHEAHTQIDIHTYIHMVKISARHPCPSIPICYDFPHV